MCKVAGAVGGQVRAWALMRGVDAGSGEDIRRDTAERDREVSELVGDNLGAPSPAEQREGREAATKMR